MRYNLFIAIYFTLSSANTQAQTGTLSFSLWDFEDYTNEDIVLFDLKLYHADTLFANFALHYEDGFDMQEDIAAGFYRFELYMDESMIQVLDPVEIVDGEETIVEMKLPTVSHIKEFDYGEDFHALMNFNYSTGGYMINQDPKFKSNNNFGLKFGFQQRLWNYQSLGFEYGYNVNFIQLQEAGFMYPDQNFKKEKYFYSNMDFFLYTRIALYNLRTNRKAGAFIDLGATYNFPLFFRHVGVLDEFKGVTHKLHRYNDFTLYGRIGYGAFAFTFQYGLTNFIKEPFPQVPLIKAGISFLLYDNSFEEYYYEEVE